GAVHLDLPVVVRLLVDEHRLFVVNVLARGEFAASFQQQNALARSGTGVSEGSSSGTATDHDHVAFVGHRDPRRARATLQVSSIHDAFKVLAKEFMKASRGRDGKKRTVPNAINLSGFQGRRARRAKQG